jgi:hypothetical protein
MSKLSKSEFLLRHSQGICQTELEDTKGVIRIRKSKDKQHNGQKKKDKMINNVLQNITQKTKDQVTLTPLITGGELMFSGRISWS